jgi:hypothetical protein
MNFDPLDTFSQTFLATYADMHDRQTYTTPRWSGIASCARKQYYAISGVEPTNPSDGRGIWVAEKGRFVQEEVLKTLERMGHNVVTWEGRVRDRLVHVVIDDKPTSLIVTEPDDNRADYPNSANPLITGHIDAEVEFYDRPDYGITVVDCKDRNFLAYMRWASNPLTDADPEAYFQMQGYLLCRKRAWACFVVTAQDSAATKGEITKKMRGKNGGGPFPNPAIFRFFVPANVNVPPLLLLRATTLTACRDNERLPEREHKPGHSWRCDYCDFRQRCERDGEGGLEVPHWADPDWAARIEQGNLLGVAR